MAFGGLRTTFKNSATSIGTSIVASGTRAVRLGDLIFVVGGEQTALTITGVTDNLGNSYTSCNNTVNTTGAITGRAFWARVKDDGTLTTVTMACNGGTNNGVIVVAIIEGPITNAIDSDPANITSDITSPFNCPTTGTLGQANEIVIGFLVGSGSTVNTATSPNLLADQQATASILHATIGYQAVTVTTAVIPVFAAGSNPANQLMGVASFRRDDTPLGAGKRLGMQWLPTPVGLPWPASFLIWNNQGLSLTAEVPVTYLPSVAVWGPPPLDTRYRSVLATWANELNLPLNVAPEAPEAPFSKLDWSLPQGLIAKGGTWVLPSQDLAPPFVPPSWSIPQGFATKGGAWINPVIQAVAEPPDTTNLPSTASGWYVPPVVPQTPSYVQPKSIALTPEVVVSLPFGKTDWPNPRAAERAANLTWTTGLPPIQFVTRAPLIARHNEQSWHVALKPQFVNLLPFAPPPVVEPPDTTNLPSVATSWTIPTSLPPLNQSFTQPLSLPLNTVVEALPFGKTDWPNPRALPRPVDLSWVSSPHALQRPNIQPFNKSDWTVPPGQAPQSHSFTLAYSLPLNTVVPVPFNQLSWPNPRDQQRNVVHSAWVYSAPPVPPVVEPPDTTNLPSTVTGWPAPAWPVPTILRILIGNSQIVLNPPEVVIPPEPDFPPHLPPTDSGGAGIKSGVWKPGQQGKRANYRSYRFITEKEIEQLTGREIRQSARDLRADVRSDPLAEEVAKEIAALARIVDVLADADRLEASVAELSRAIEYARRARAEAEAEDEEISFLLLS